MARKSKSANVTDQAPERIPFTPPPWWPFATELVEKIAGRPVQPWAFLGDAPAASISAGLALVSGMRALCPEDATQEDEDRLVEHADVHGMHAFFASLAEEAPAKAAPMAPAAIPPSPQLRFSSTRVALQIGRYFGSVAGFRAALQERHLLLLRSGPELEAPLEKMLHRLRVDRVLCGGNLPQPLICNLSSLGNVTTYQTLSEELRTALEIGSPVFLLADHDAPLPPAFADLGALEHDISHVDRGLVAAHLALAFPQAGKALLADTLAELPEEAALADLTPGGLMRALRHSSLPDAAAEIRRSVTLPDQGISEPGFDAFPLAPEVRAPLQQMREDLQDWRTGKIDWKDVTRGILLVGPPGCGKTEIPRLLARDIDLPVFAGSLADWQSRSDGTTRVVSSMSSFFKRARAKAPCIVFIDEIDAFGDRARVDHNSAWTDNIVGALLQQLDGFADREGVVVIAATNHPQKIDAALKRPGRFDQAVRIGLPDFALMPAVLRWHLGDALGEESLARLARKLIGMSGAEVAELCRRARAAARRDKVALIEAHLVAACETTRPPVGKERLRLIAIHEAGHAIMGHLTGRYTPTEINLATGNGFVQMRKGEDPLYKSELLAELAILMAGRAAERVMLGQHSTGSGGGSQSDLARASCLALALDCSLGLGVDGPVWFGEAENLTGLLAYDVNLRARVRTRLNRAEEIAVMMLRTHLETLTRLADEAAARTVLGADDIASVLDTIDCGAGLPDLAREMDALDSSQNETGEAS